MTQWNPIWKVEIDGVEYTDAILANLTIRSGRTNIYEQAQAGYVNIQLLDLAQTIIPVNINSTIGVSVKDTAGVFVAIFGGNVVDIALEVREVGSTAFTQTYSITALGALARLPKTLTEGVLSKDLTAIKFRQSWNKFYSVHGLRLLVQLLGQLMTRQLRGQMQKTTGLAR